MNTKAAAASAAERYAVAKDRGHAALSAMMAARAEANAAQAAKDAAESALQDLADSHVAGSAAEPETVQAALSALAETESRVWWAGAVLAAAQRAVVRVKEEVDSAEREAMSAAETDRKASLHSRVLELAGQV